MVIILEKANMGLASGIGLVSEVINAYKKPEVETTTRELNENDEEQWVLDETQDELRRELSRSDEDRVENDGAEDNPKKKIRNPSLLADDFLRRHPKPVVTPGGSSSVQNGRLPLPVIIPQRRPKVRVRGFVRAYAPDLMNCGIDQDTFMDFLVTYTRASRAPAWMGAFNLTANAAFALPGHVMGCGVGFAIQVVNAVAMELKGRSQSNTFVKKLNEGFFQPRGLYCLIMSFDNTHEEAMTEESLKTNISSTIESKSGIQKYTDKIRLHSGSSGPLDFPEAATLVFPMLDWLNTNAVADEEQAKKLGKYKKFRKFVADYYDRRAQAEYAAKNPTSPLATQLQRPFTSKFADPTDSTNMSPISLATGGLVKYNTTWRQGTRDPEGRGARRKIANKVLYMIIVNMPTEGDMSRAERIVESESQATT